ncbi:MAG: hypothetical protein KGM16_13610 [Bacteroidota bacterium]|nr:hypothetical protein [Bacteroidota bacterium]
MSHTLFTIFFNHSIIIAAAISFFRFKSVSGDYYPFIFLIWLGLLNESISLALLYNGSTNAVNSNIFVLLEYLLILFQFYKWNESNVSKYYLLAFLGLLVWTSDNFFLNSIRQNNSVFRVFYSFVILFFSIDKVNKIIILENLRLTRNAMFLMCITFIFYYGFKACVESFNMIHLGLSVTFLRKLWFILYFVNFISNLLFALAVLWIPTRQKFILRY